MQECVNFPPQCKDFQSLSNVNGKKCKNTLTRNIYGVLAWEPCPSICQAVARGDKILMLNAQLYFKY